MLTEQQARERFKHFALLVQKYPSPISVATRLAQCFVESQLFTSDLAHKANNGFGIKASAPWTGKTYSHLSPEVGGARVSEFRAYDSVEDSIKDHASFFTSTAYRAETAYKQAIQADNYKDEANALTGIYAGDPDYGKQLIRTIEKYNLTQYNKESDKPMRDLMVKLFETQRRTRLVKHTQVNMGGAIGQIRYIVIHFVGASGQALANANYFFNVFRSASAHIFIDPKVTYEVVPENRVGWHVGDGLGKYGITNQNSLGIEGCQDVSTGRNVWEWQFHENTYIQMILETDYWMDKYNVPLDRVVRHYDASRKSCPGNWMAHDWLKWWRFKADLKEYRELKAKGIKDVAPVDVANPQGFEQSDIPAYRAPKQAFDAKKKGDVVHYREFFSWFNPQNNKWIMSPNIPNWANTQDTIVDVMEVNVSYSKRAYLMEKSKSWILEQDLREPRAQWQDKSAGTYTVQKGDYLYKIAEEFGTTVEKLKLWNALESNMIFTGMELFVVEPFEHMPEDETPVSTDDSDGNEQVSTPEDKGDKTPAVELADDEVMDAKGNVYKISEGLVITPK